MVKDRNLSYLLSRVKKEIVKFWISVDYSTEEILKVRLFHFV